MKKEETSKNIFRRMPTAIYFSIAIIIAAIVLGEAYSKKYESKGTITVTGLGEKDFTSNLIVWSGNFSVIQPDLQTAYSTLENNKKIVNKYLTDKGLKNNEIVFDAVSTDKEIKRNYDNMGRFIGEEFVGYHLTQVFTVQSNSVEQVEKISREITELINQGVEIYSYSPRYYYTKMADLKIKMVSEATADARLRADQIATNSGAKLGELIDAKMGIFQITGQNSDEEYSWGGTYNTTSKEKTASITMKLVFKVK